MNRIGIGNQSRKLARIWQKVVLVACVLGATACNYNLQGKTSSEEAPPPPPENRENTDMKISFETVSSFSLKTCLNCHSGRQTPTFKTYSQLKGSLVKVLDEVDTNSMPPADSVYPLLSACQKAVLEKWNEMGAPEMSEISTSTLTECN